MKYYTADLLMVFFAGAIGWFGNAAYQKSKPKPTVQAVIKQESLEEFVERQPRGYLQANLYCIMAAHKECSDEQLYDALYPYAIAQREKLIGIIKEMSQHTNPFTFENELYRPLDQTNRAVVEAGSEPNTYRIIQPPNLRQPEAVKAQAR